MVIDIVIPLVVVSMSQGGQRALPQSKEAQLRDYTMRLKSNVKAMFENFTEIIKLARVRFNTFVIFIDASPQH